MLHVLEPEEGFLHGWFRPDLEPIRTIEPGDRLRWRTLDVGGGLTPMGPDRRRIQLDGPCMHGPVAVRGARPGDTLAVTLHEIVPGPWGWTLAGGEGFHNRELNRRLRVDREPRLVIPWTRQGDRFVDPDGFTVTARPFPGVLGVAAPEPWSGWFPHAGGGNMDCRELIAGTTLYLPVLVEGALLSVGDGHAYQGDGELSGTAIECPFEAIELEVQLRRDFPVVSPHIAQGDRWITLGFSDSLDRAVDDALNPMLDLLMREHAVGRARALALASLAVDVRITQLVNGTRGVHAVYEPGRLNGA